MLSGTGMLIRGAPAQGKTRLGIHANALTISSDAAVGGQVRATEAVITSPGAQVLTLTAGTTAEGLASERRLEVGQHFGVGGYMQMQSSMNVGNSTWVPVQFVLNPQGGGLWLPHIANNGYNGLCINTPMPTTSHALDCRGNVVLDGFVTLPGLPEAASDDDARAMGAVEGSLYSHNGLVHIVRPK